MEHDGGGGGMSPLVHVMRSFIRGLHYLRCIESKNMVAQKKLTEKVGL
jgi:hypothetical protein